MFYTKVIVCTQLGRDTTVFYVSSPFLSCVRVCDPLRPNLQMAHELRALKSWASDYGLVARAASHGDALPRPKPFRTPGQNGQTVPTQRALLQWLKACLATPIASLLEPETTWMFMAFKCFSMVALSRCFVGRSATLYSPFSLHRRSRLSATHC